MEVAYVVLIIRVQNKNNQQNINLTCRNSNINIEYLDNLDMLEFLRKVIIQIKKILALLPIVYWPLSICPALVITLQTAKRGGTLQS